MIDGRYFPPGSSRAVAASLAGGPGRLALKREDEPQAQAVVLMSVSDPLAGVPRKLTFADGGVFEAPLEADVDGFLNTGGSFFARLTRLEANLGLVAAAAVVTVGLVFAIYRFGIPLLASGAAAITPPPIVAAMDRGTLETVDRVVFSPSELDEGRKQELQAMFDELAGFADDAGPALKLQLRRGGAIGANALALPGGTIVVTDELVALAASDDEIAGVIAHEIGHVRERHSLQQIYRVLGIGFMVGLIGGDASQLVDDVVTQASALQTLVYSREFETHADLYSVALMARAGRDPLAFVDLLDRIVRAVGGSDETGWLATHPGTKDRREAVRKRVEELGEAGGTTRN
ncbi:M48 family metallopeptidase [Nitratireductor rhodophyticola]|uniref:M48 family metallopeptidase n=1 Tax=Nitratireductor rhodophyticola TaxID=2854036 RepID=UPI002AC8D134|nr:M48 family metallopeptidase [Nitratireductor rhodophyticola]WPZ13351.1 M48 family metallopeptidase [Nitratireductor rhodophyticola]